jgi:hypothetical protein
MTEEIKITKSSGCVFRDIGVPCPTPDEIRRATLLEIAGLARCRFVLLHEGQEPPPELEHYAHALDTLAQKLERMAKE